MKSVALLPVRVIRVISLLSRSIPAISIFQALSVCPETYRAVHSTGFSTTKVRSHEARLMGQWVCRPTTILRVGGADPSWLRTFVVENRGLARAAGPNVIAPQPGRRSDFMRQGRRAVHGRGYTLSAGGRLPGRTLRDWTHACVMSGDPCRCDGMPTKSMPRSCLGCQPAIAAAR